MPLSANQLKLESSIQTRAKRATNRNNVAAEKQRYIFFRGDFGRGDFILEPSMICMYIHKEYILEQYMLPHDRRGF